jgi:hypothetical protein
MMLRSLCQQVGTQWWPVLVLVLGCESTTFVDCPTFEMESCLETDACRYRLYGDGSGECRNTCDPFEEEPCPPGFECDVASYWDPSADKLSGSQEDLCVDP